MALPAFALILAMEVPFFMFFAGVYAGANGDCPWDLCRRSRQYNSQTSKGLFSLQRLHCLGFALHKFNTVRSYCREAVRN
jgi:hypothetical protein